MKIKRLLSSLLVSLLIMGQAPWTVMAEDVVTPTSTTAVTQEPTPPSTSAPLEPVASASPEPVVEPAPTTTIAPSASEPSTVGPSPIEPTSTGTTTVAPSSSNTNEVAAGPQQPTGVIPDYAFNDAIRKWEPTIRNSFSWDMATGLWVSPLYWYDPVVGWYHVKQAAALSNPDYVAAGAATLSDMADPMAALGALLADPLNANTGPNSSNSASLNNSNNALLNLVTLATITNSLNSTATSGNASVSGNTIGGNATSGPANVVANLLNFINSLWSWSNGGFSYFVNNLFGNQNGDIALQPTTTTNGGGGLFGCATCTGGVLNANQNTGPGSTNQAMTTESTDLTVNYRPTGVINNNLDLLARSGNASVDSNTFGGNATSGDASVQLNIMNLINSAIGAGQSFFGMLNIFGNLNGDILFPQGFLDGIAQPSPSTPVPSCSASNDTTGSGSTNDAACSQTTNATVNNSPSAHFNNDINLGARSGAALVDSNTNAGNATSGQADTSTNTYNLFNSGVYGDNAVLVLVNVMGRWVGRIMNLPSPGGSTAALLTGNATVQNLNTGSDSLNEASYTGTTDMNVNNSPTGIINNNIRAGAISGNASVTNNTNAGSAVSGAAKVASNVANFFGSTLNLKQWFGVLIINVFGDWTGSVNENTSAGGEEGQPVNALSQGEQQSTATSTRSNTQGLGSNNVAATGGGTGGGSLDQSQASRINTPRSAKVAGAQGLSKEAQTTSTNPASVFLMLTAICLLAAGALMGLDRKLNRRI